MHELPAGHSAIDVVPLGGVPGTWTYAVGPEHVERALPGRRVLVTFAGRRTAAIVLGPARQLPEGPLRLIDDVLDDEPLLIPEVLELARWAADYYAAPLSHAVRAALPPGSDVEEKRTPELSETGRAALVATDTPPMTRKALRALAEGELQLLRAGTIKRLVSEKLVVLRREVVAGALVPTIEWVVRTAPPDASFPANHRVQRAVWEQVAHLERVPMEVVQAAVPNARDAIQRMEKRGLLRVERQPLTANLGGAFQSVAGEPTPTDEQIQVLESLVARLGTSKPKPVLLEGVTGSGKTEVYLRLIAAARARGGGAIVLVPEIALTPQMSARFRARFGAEVAVLHSGLTDRDRAAEWHRVRRGEAPIVVGARSAVFAPLERPQVIIVDEEHDGSFKQGEGLRYQGRDLATVRARLSGAVCVLGSATPSLETTLNATTGRFDKLALTKRVDSSRPMPAVQLVDLRGRAKEKADGGVMPSGLLSPELVEALRETFTRGEQSIVFLNRRGHSTALLCRDCGTVHRCRSCAVAMTWHEKRSRLVCHYCGAREACPDECGNCKSTRLLLMGAGTEKVEEEIQAALPGARLGRLDRDTAGHVTRLEAILGKFARHEIDVLVGTQMVAKGHDFPGVTLVCVLLADAGLNQPDFRSAERTAQLLTQVAGRAGRGEKPGRVLVQTFNPETPAVAAVRTHDYKTFALAELTERESADYPPYARLCLVRFEGEREEETARIASVVAREAAPHRDETHQVLGPAPAPLARLRNKYRFQFLVRAPKPSALQVAVARIVAAKRRVPEAVRMTIDVDPVDML